MKLNEKKVALVFGLIGGGGHLFWSLLVLFEIAQPILNIIFWMHMIEPPFTVIGFSLTQASVLIITVFILWYIGGYIFAWVWNVMHK